MKTTRLKLQETKDCKVGKSLKRIRSFLFENRLRVIKCRIAPSSLKQRDQNRAFKRLSRAKMTKINP